MGEKNLINKMQDILDGTVVDSMNFKWVGKLGSMA
jgi:hypothetical protein